MRRMKVAIGESSLERGWLLDLLHFLRCLVSIEGIGIEWSSPRYHSSSILGCKTKASLAVFKTIRFLGFRFLQSVGLLRFAPNGAAKI